MTTSAAAAAAAQLVTQVNEITLGAPLPPSYAYPSFVHAGDAHRIPREFTGSDAHFDGAAARVPWRARTPFWAHTVRGLPRTCPTPHRCAPTDILAFERHLNERLRSMKTQRQRYLCTPGPSPRDRGARAAWPDTGAS